MWMDAVGVLPPVVEEVDTKGKAKENTTASVPIVELTEEEADRLQAEMEDTHLLALKELQRRERELRTTLWSNVAEARLRLVSRRRGKMDRLVLWTRC